MKKLASAFFLTLAAVVCVAQSTPEEGLNAAIAAGNQAWTDGMRRADATAIAQTYASDALNCNSSGECVTGRDAIEQRLRSLMSSWGRARTATVSSKGVVRDGDLAYEWGFAESRFAGGRALAGRYVTVWQRQADGGWKIYRNLGLPFSGRTGAYRGAETTETSYTLRCESENMNYRTCPAEGLIARAEMQRQLSGSPCVLNRTWGWKDNAVWVDRGCRADFTVYASESAPTPVREFSDTQKTVSLKCESDDMGYKFCPSPGSIQAARLVRQISGTACVETRTWGWKSDGVWVDKGCRAEFQLTTQ